MMDVGFIFFLRKCNLILSLHELFPEYNIFAINFRPVSEAFIEEAETTLYNTKQKETERSRRK